MYILIKIYIHILIFSCFIFCAVSLLVVSASQFFHFVSFSFFISDIIQVSRLCVLGIFLFSPSSYLLIKMYHFSSNLANRRCWTSIYNISPSLPYCTYCTSDIMPRGRCARVQQYDQYGSEQQKYCTVCKQILFE